MLDDYQDLIDELLGTPNLVRTLLAGTPDRATLAAVVALRDRDRLVLERLQRITREREPHLRPIPAGSDAAAGTEPPAAADLLAEFDTARGDLVSLLMNLTLRDWERTATQDPGGIVSVAGEVEAHVEFDEAQRARMGA